MPNVDALSVPRVASHQTTRSDLYDQVAAKAKTDPKGYVKISASRYGTDKGLIQLQPKPGKQEYSGNKNNLGILIDHLDMSDAERSLIKERVANLPGKQPMKWSTLRDILTEPRASIRNPRREDIDTGGLQDHGDQAEEQKVPESGFAEAGSTAPRAPARNPTWEGIETVKVGVYFNRGKALMASSSELRPGQAVHRGGVEVVYRAEVRSSYLGKEVDVGETETSLGQLFTRSLSACTPVIAIAENEGAVKKAVLCHAQDLFDLESFVKHTNALGGEGFTIMSLSTVCRTTGKWEKHWIIAAAIERHARLIDSKSYTHKLAVEAVLAVEVDPVAGTVVVSHS